MFYKYKMVYKFHLVFIKETEFIKSKYSNSFISLYHYTISYDIITINVQPSVYQVLSSLNFLFYYMVIK